MNCKTIIITTQNNDILIVLNTQMIYSGVFEVPV